MKVLVTGSKGFIGKNLIISLQTLVNIEVLTYSKSDSLKELEEMIIESDFIFHLAGINRPQTNQEFYQGNNELTELIIGLIEKYDKKIPILLSSSKQVGNDSDYAKSKELSEKLVQEYSIKNDINCFIYRLPNVFGKWCKPNYNSVIATWCYNITRNLDIQIDDDTKMLELVYIGDVVHSFLDRLYVNQSKDIFYQISTIYTKTLGEIYSLLIKFRESRETLLIPKIAKGFERVLYATYLSYLPEDKFSYKLNGYKDNRGTFYEILKTLESGQLGISTTKPGITRGNHYHHTKNEKFLVLKGEAVIELREVYSKKIIQYNVSGEELEIVEMIPGYTHNITNVGDDEMVLLIWANESYNPSKPDTRFLEV